MSNAEKICKFLDEAKVYFFATVEDEKPHVRPMNVYKLINGKVYFLVADHKSAYKQLQKNPNCELISFKGAGDWLRISGKTVFIKDESIPQQLVDTDKSYREFYDKNGYKPTAFYFEGHAEINKLGNNIEKFEI